MSVETEYDDLVSVNSDGEFEYEMPIPETTAKITLSQSDVFEYLEKHLERPLTKKEKKIAWNTFTWSDCFSGIFPGNRCPLGESDYENYMELYEAGVKEAIQNAIQDIFNDIWDMVLDGALEEALQSIENKDEDEDENEDENEDKNEDKKE